MGQRLDEPIPWGAAHRTSLDEVYPCCAGLTVVFVTAGAVSPTSTVQALALYIGGPIKRNVANLFDRRVEAGS